MEPQVDASALAVLRSRSRAVPVSNATLPVCGHCRDRFPPAESDASDPTRFCTALCETIATKGK